MASSGAWSMVYPAVVPAYPYRQQYGCPWCRTHTFGVLTGSGQAGGLPKARNTTVFRPKNHCFRPNYPVFRPKPTVLGQITCFQAKIPNLLDFLLDFEVPTPQIQLVVTVFWTHPDTVGINCILDPPTTRRVQKPRVAHTVLSVGPRLVDLAACFVIS